jgi:hypothetical protein
MLLLKPHLGERREQLFSNREIVLSPCIFFKEAVPLHAGTPNSTHSKSGSNKVCAKSIGSHDALVNGQ